MEHGLRKFTLRVLSDFVIFWSQTRLWHDMSPLAAVFLSADVLKGGVLLEGGVLIFEVMLAVALYYRRCSIKGCSPTNDNDDENYLKAGEKITKHDFVFKCHESQDGKLDYESVACIDPFGQAMKPGEKRMLSNGTIVLSCKVVGTSLKKVYERATGCFYNGIIYSDEETWVEPVKDSPDNSIDGLVKTCFNVRMSFHEVHTIGCAIGSTQILQGEVGKLPNGTFMKCVQYQDEHWMLKSVDDIDMSCQYENHTLPHDSLFADSDKFSIIQCLYGSTKKIGCVLKDKSVEVGKMAVLSNDCVLICAPTDTVYGCRKIPDDVEIVEELDSRLPTLF
uniref:Abnormal cell migration protein 18-like fibronectin type I domain-containing protein n=1 Tax=Caenorhabditis japonica TaxID=281687 RepID=A0A8R1DFM2_CAEJA